MMLANTMSVMAWVKESEAFSKTLVEIRQYV